MANKQPFLLFLRMIRRALDKIRFTILTDYTNTFSRALAKKACYLNCNQEVIMRKGVFSILLVSGCFRLDLGQVPDCTVRFNVEICPFIIGSGTAPVRELNA